MARGVKDKVVVITGASGGIGRATARAFAAEKAILVLAARREGPLRDVADECTRLGARALALPTDVTDEQAVRHLARTVVDTFGRIDVWVNNAAVTLFGRFEEAPYESYRRVLETNLFGYIHGARAAIPYFREQGEGVLINNASVVARFGQPYTSAYVTSQFAIRGLSECLRQELAGEKGIRVCLLLPAAIDTPLFDHAANYTGRAVQPVPPVYSAEKVARAILDLALHPKPERFVGNAGRMLALQHVLMPRLTNKAVARTVERHHFQDRLADRTDGNLFEPMARGTGVSGGWRHVQHRRNRAVLLGALGLAVPAAALLLVGRATRTLG